MIEIWKSVEGYEGSYEVSNFGKVRSITRQVSGKLGSVRTIFGKVLADRPYQGYMRVLLLKNGIHKAAKVHRLVAKAFIPNPENKPFVNHVDSNPSNNRVDNLEWCTPAENIQHAERMNRMVHLMGKDHPNAILTEEMVIEMRKKRNKGLTYPAIGKLFNLKEDTVRKACIGIGWSHVNYPPCPIVTKYTKKSEYWNKYGTTRN